MVPLNVPSLKLMILGWVFFLAFAIPFIFLAPHDEASFLTRSIVFVGLIVPPVCFAAGIGLSMMRKGAGGGMGVWANGAAIVTHGVLAIAMLQRFLA
jgi:hypothetical protein